MMLLWRYGLVEHINAGSFCDMTSMVFALLCFTGVFVMFLYLVRSLEKFQERMRNEHAQLRVRMRALEARLDILTGTEPAHVPHPAHAPLPGDPQAPLTLIPKDPLDEAQDDLRMRFEPKR